MIEAKIAYIMSEFLDDRRSREINISFKNKTETLDNYEKFLANRGQERRLIDKIEKETFYSAMFEDAKLEVLAILNFDLLPRFTRMLKEKKREHFNYGYNTRDNRSILMKKREKALSADNNCNFNCIDIFASEQTRTYTTKRLSKSSSNDNVHNLKVLPPVLPLIKEKMTRSLSSLFSPSVLDPNRSLHKHTAAMESNVDVDEEEEEFFFSIESPRNKRHLSMRTSEFGPKNTVSCSEKGKAAYNDNSLKKEKKRRVIFPGRTISIPAISEAS